MDACRRLKTIADRLKRFTNLDQSESHNTDLNGLFRDTVSQLQSELGEKAEVVLDLNTIPPVRCRPQQLSAVFSSLLRNAAVAIEDKGTIWVRSYQRDGEIRLEVEDNGKGIPASRLPYLFEPAFAVTEGRVSTTNWGLFTSRSIIIEHGGQIDIQSQEGKGTIVTIQLPVSGQKRRYRRQPGESPGPVCGGPSATLLLLPHIQPPASQCR